MKRKCMCIILLIIVITQMGSVIAYANNTKASVITERPIDTTEGYIKGENCDFVFRIPTNWSPYIKAYRETLVDNSKICEILNFYYKPVNVTNKSVFLISVFVYEKKNWYESVNYKKLLETDHYVFAYYVAAYDNQFVNKADRILYTYFHNELRNGNIISELITFPNGISPVPKDTIYVNGVLLNSKIIFRDNGTPYLPLREICEKLGYKVGYNAKNRSITINKNKSNHTLNIDATEDEQNFGLLLIQEVSYISTSFFMHVLKTNIEIDEHGNVYITEKTHQ